VHSAKDMATQLPRGLAIAACLPREDPRDVFVSRSAKNFGALPRGARIGTASLRRAALARRLRSDLVVVPMRGNVETRLRKIADGEADATILALAGLRRLGLDAAATAILEVDEFLPAVGQGVIAIEARADDDRSRALAEAINDAEAAIALATERAFLAVLDGSCKTPIAGHAWVDGGVVRFSGLIVKPDGSEAVAVARAGPLRDAAMLGADAGSELKARAGADFLTVP
jgi:hydroxymethylbilane synthase